MISVMCASQYQSSSCSHWWRDRWGWICNGHTPAWSNATHSNQGLNTPKWECHQCSSLACYPDHISIKRPGMPGALVLKVARSGLAARQNMDTENWAYIGSVWAEKSERWTHRGSKSSDTVFLLLLLFLSSWKETLNMFISKWHHTPKSSEM